MVQPRPYAPFRHNIDGADHARAFRVTNAGGLNVSVAAGRHRIDQTVTNYAAATPLVMNNNATNYVYIDNGGVIAFRSAPASYPVSSWPLARVVTLAGDITGITDDRAIAAAVDTPAGGGGVPHPILDGTGQHTDTAAQGVSTGSIIYGDGTPEWNELVRVVPGGPALRRVLGFDQGDTIPAWKITLNAVNPANIAAAAAPGTSLIYSHRDHVHAHPNIAADLHDVYLLASGTRDVTGNLAWDDGAGDSPSALFIGQHNWEAEIFLVNAAAQDGNFLRVLSPGFFFWESYANAGRTSSFFTANNRYDNPFTTARAFHHNIRLWNLGAAATDYMNVGGLDATHQGILLHGADNLVLWSGNVLGRMLTCITAREALCFATTATDAAGRHVMVFFQGTAPAGGVANSAQLWAEDIAGTAELRAMDEAGVISTLTSEVVNDCDCPMPITRVKENVYLGVKAAINLCCLAKEIERLTGRGDIIAWDMDRPKGDWNRDEVEQQRQFEEAQMGDALRRARQELEEAEMLGAIGPADLEQGQGEIDAAEAVVEDKTLTYAEKKTVFADRMGATLADYQPRHIPAWLARRLGV